APALSPAEHRATPQLHSCSPSPSPSDGSPPSPPESGRRGRSWCVREGETKVELNAEYVIVGAGSAGGVLADRLSEDGAQVVLLEAGPTDWHPMIHVPAGALH